MRRRFYIQMGTIVLSAIVLSSVIYYAACAGLRHSRQGEPGKISYILFDTTHYDVLFTGSSRISRNIDPHLFRSLTQYQSYNAGIDGAGFATMDWLTRAFIKVHGAPGYVFINIDVYAMEVESALFYYPMFYPYLSRDTRALEAAETRLRRGRWLPFLAVSDIDDYLKGVALNATLHSEASSGDTVFQRSGFEPIYTEAYTGKDDSMILTFDYDVSNFTKLDSLCASCLAKGTRVFFLMSPIYGAYMVDTDNSTTFYKYLRAIEAKYSITELNYYTDQRFTHDMFFNRTHLNHHGAEAYTALLADTFSSIKADGQRASAPAEKR